ncbi:MAG: hypothetical protein EXS10_05805 [Phycisphaerales bacterium]|nr:hypothetical protein [Phycisphaerales bacterium]
MTAAPSRPTDARQPSNRPRNSQATVAAPRIDPVRILRQHLWTFVITLFVGLGLGAIAQVVLSMVYPLYWANVLFELRAPPEEVGDVIVRDDRTEEAVERLGQTEAARILSRQLLEKAVSNRDIEQTTWSQGYRDENGRFVVADAVDDLEDELSAGHKRRTAYFELSWSTHVAGDVPVVLNRIAETYTAEEGRREEERFVKNRGAFKKQLEQMETELNDLDTQIATFISSRNMTSLNDDRNDMLLMLEDTSRQINESKNFLTLSETRRQQTHDKMDGRLEPSADDIRSAEQDPQLADMNRSVNFLVVAVETVKRKFGENHPAVISADREANAGVQERDALVRRILQRNLAADFKEYSDQSESYTTLLDKFQTEFTAQQTRMKEFASALSSVKQLQDRRGRLVEQRSKQVEIIGSIDQLKARDDARRVTISQSAVTPRILAFPKWKLMLPLGAAIALGAVAGIIFLREFLDQRVRYASDLLGIPNLRLLGMVPDLSEDPLSPEKVERVVRESPRSVLAESCRQIAGQVFKQMDAAGLKTLLCMSGLPEAGTTCLVTNLAESGAAAGRKVLVVDANFRRSHLAAAMGLEPDAVGLGDFLRGGAGFGSIIRSAGEGVDCVGAGTPETRVYELLGTPQMTSFLAQASAQYDIVIVDAPPAVVAADGATIANQVGGALIVARAFQEQRGLVARMAAQLTETKAQVIGVVLSRPINTAGGYFRKNFETMAKYGGA